MTDFEKLQDVVVTLEYHEEEKHARILREYITSQRGITAKIYRGLRKFMFWFILVGVVVAVVYGFIRSMLDGAFFSALGVLLFGTLIFGAIAAIDHYAKAVYDWFEDKERVQ